MINLEYARRRWSYAMAIIFKTKKHLEEKIDSMIKDLRKHMALQVTNLVLLKIPAIAFNSVSSNV